MNRILAFLVLAFVSINLYSQRAFMDIPDTTDYYEYFFTKNIDSLSKQWHYNEFLEKDVLYKDLSKIDIHNYNINQRSKDILNIYLNNFEKSINAFAINQFYKDTLEQIFLSNDLSANLKYLPFALSGMNPEARANSGAYSYFQLAYAASRVHKLNVDSYVDERKMLIKSAKAAADYISHLKKIYNDEDLALLAFSCGPRNLNKAIRRNNNTRNIDSLYNSLPDFGRDAVYALNSTLCFDSVLIELNQILPVYNVPNKYDTIEVSKRLHFIQLADILKVTIDSIRFLNPQYKYDIIPADEEVYRILMPFGYLQKFNEFEDSIYSYKDSSLFDMHKRIILPPPAKGRSYARYEPEPIPEGSKVVYYHIKSGDNLGYISSWYGVSVSKLKDWNNIYNERRLQLNQKLKIYVPEEKYSYYSKIDNMSFNEKQKLSGGSTRTETKKKQPLPLGDDFFYYTVKQGESPYLIAKKFPGVSADDIVRWNKIDPRYLKPGDKLRIKKIK